MVRKNTLKKYLGGGDCLVKYRLLHQTLDFYSQAYNLKFTTHYFKYSEATEFRDFYEAKMDDVPIIKPVNAFFAMSGKNKPSLYVLGVEHKSVFSISNNSDDSIYIGGNVDPTKIVRIKQQNDIYELLP